jgi:hypothetical protein
MLLILLEDILRIFILLGCTLMILFLLDITQCSSLFSKAFKYDLTFLTELRYSSSDADVPHFS